MVLMLNDGFSFLTNSNAAFSAKVLLAQYAVAPSAFLAVS